MILTQKLMFVMTLWTGISLLISYEAGFEVFFTLQIIGLLIVREFVDAFASLRTKERLDLFIYAGLIIFSIIVLRRVWLAVA